MYIQFQEQERSLLMEYDLPSGTRLMEKDNKDSPLKLWEINKNGSWELITDYEEEDRYWKEGEREEYEKELDKDKVLDYFIKYEDSGPYRVYSVMSEAEKKYFKYIHHSGAYHYEEDRDKFYNIFMLRIPPNGKYLDEAIKEITFVLDRIREAYGNDFPSIDLEVMEDTCAENGAYYIEWRHTENTFVLCKAYYGARSEIDRFGSLEALIKYLSENHPYRNHVLQYT